MNKASNSESRSAYRQGWIEGYRMGGCLSVIERTPIGGAAGSANLRILYVQQGFESVDTGIIHALQGMVKELAVASPNEMLPLAEQFRPDLILVMNGLHVFPAEHTGQIDLLREQGVRTAIWFVDDPYFTDQTAMMALHYDYVFTHELSCIQLYRDAGCREVHYLPLAADPEIYAPVDAPRNYQTDICFIGSAFWNRVALFDQLAPYLATKRVLLIGQLWNRLTRQDLLQSFTREGWVEPKEARIYYGGAKIVINMHRPTETGQDNENSRNLPGLSINPRTYEIASCGTLQLTDIREDLHRHYRPGYDIETFASAEELQSKLEYYLTHDTERIQMAWRSLWTTRKNHTYTNRMAHMLAVVQ